MHQEQTNCSSTPCWNRSRPGWPIRNSAPAPARADPAHPPPTDTGRRPGDGHAAARLTPAGQLPRRFPRHHRGRLRPAACRRLHRAPRRQWQLRRRGHPAVTRQACPPYTQGGRRRSRPEQAWRDHAAPGRRARAPHSSPLRPGRAGDPHLSSADLGAPAAPGAQEFGAKALLHGDPQGLEPLRRAIADYVNLERGARTTADQVLVLTSRSRRWGCAPTCCWMRASGSSSKTRCTTVRARPSRRRAWFARPSPSTRTACRSTRSWPTRTPHGRCT